MGLRWFLVVPFFLIVHPFLFLLLTDGVAVILGTSGFHGPTGIAVYAACGLEVAAALLIVSAVARSRRRARSPR